ncbi:hypothetical protein FACS1894186_5400 [Alphaproteobacteria bacterium]|nr:hypothetical protein FACS1894186_5400 [Alphaproteobacteria bacterium]
MEKITIADLKAKLQEALDNLERFNDEDAVEMSSNTYFVKSNYFLSLGSAGFCPLFDVEIESDDEDED